MLSSQKRITGIRGTYGYLVGDCGLPSGRGLVEGCEAPEEDDRYKGNLRLSDRGLWSPLWKGTCRGLRGRRVLWSQKRMTGIRGTYGYLVGDCGLPSGRGLVEGCEACVVVPVPEEWSPLWMTGMTGRGTYGYLVGDCGLPSGRGLVEGCEACVVVPEEDDRYKGNLRLSGRGLWSPLWKGTCRGLRGVCCGPRYKGNLRLSGRGTVVSPSGRGLVEGCVGVCVVPEEDDRYKGNLRLSDRGLWSPLWKGTCRGLRGVCCRPRRG